jgi:hypothetical protein
VRDGTHEQALAWSVGRTVSYERGLNNCGNTSRKGPIM